MIINHYEILSLSLVTAGALIVAFATGQIVVINKIQKNINLALQKQESRLSPSRQKLSRRDLVVLRGGRR